MHYGKFALGALCVLAALQTRVEAQSFSHTWVGTDPTENPRLFRNGVPSVAGTAKPFPGTISETDFYQTYTFVNPVAQANVFTLTPTTEDTSSFFSAYLGSFDPTNLALHYLGDQGSSAVAALFSVDVPASQTVVVVANSVGGTTAPIGHTYAATGAFTITATPEPGSIALLVGMGVSGAGFLARRRHSARRAA